MGLERGKRGLAGGLRTGLRAGATCEARGNCKRVTDTQVPADEEAGRDVPGLGETWGKRYRGYAVAG